VIVYQYGLHSPHENAHVVFEQMRLAHRYRNTLCAIERARRAAMRAMLRDLSALLLEYETAAAKWHAEVEVVLGRIKASRKASRKRSESEADKALLREARAMHKSAVGLLREARRQAREAPHVVAETERINALAADLKRNARAHSGLYWGTYLRIEDAAAQSAKMPLYDGEHPNDPRFIRWRPDCWHGECAVQLQNGLPLDRLVSGADTRLRLTLPEVGAWDHPSWAERHRRARTAALQMRVASTKSGAPVWATFTLDMHRPLPKDSVVKWAVVQRVPVGPHFRWVLLLTVDAPTTGILPETGSIVALDVGWRALEGGLRVACWRGSDGASG